MAKKVDEAVKEKEIKEENPEIKETETVNEEVTETEETSEGKEPEKKTKKQKIKKILPWVIGGITLIATAVGVAIAIKNEGSDEELEGIEKNPDLVPVDEIIGEATIVE